MNVPDIALRFKNSAVLKGSDLIYPLEKGSPEPQGKRQIPFQRLDGDLNSSNVTICVLPDNAQTQFLA